MNGTTQPTTELLPQSKKRIEFRSDIPISNRKRSRYHLDIWFFIPISLGINRWSYGHKGFFSDFRSFTRIGDSVLSLSAIIEKEQEASPLTRLRQYFDSDTRWNKSKKKKALFEFRNLACLYSFESYSLTSYQGSDIGRKAIKTWLNDATEFLEQWHALNHLVLKKTTPKKIRAAYEWADESISMSTERSLASLYRDLDTDDDHRPMLKKIRKLLLREKGYREEAEYCFLSPEATEKELEQRIYRESILKKWRESVLYLSQEKSSLKQRMDHILAGTSAALAMMFAVAASLFADRLFPGNSLLWATTLVVAYIFKDRIKEVLRTVLIHTFPALVSDKEIKLRDPESNTRIGTIHNRVRFLRYSDIPSEIMSVSKVKASRFSSLLPEKDIIHFQHQVSVHTDRIRSNHTTIVGLTDIFRHNLDKFFTNMDDPIKEVPIFSEGRPVYAEGYRIYSVNVVMRMREEKDSAGTIRSYHLVLTQEGLRRIEEIE